MALCEAEESGVISERESRDGLRESEGNKQFCATSYAETLVLSSCSGAESNPTDSGLP